MAALPTCAGPHSHSHKRIALLLLALRLQAYSIPHMHPQHALDHLLEVVRIHVDGLCSARVQLLRVEEPSCEERALQETADVSINALLTGPDCTGPDPCHLSAQSISDMEELPLGQTQSMIQGRQCSLIISGNNAGTFRPCIWYAT